MSEDTDTPDVLAELQPDLSLEIGREAEATSAQLQASAMVGMKRMQWLSRQIEEIEERTRLEVSSIQGMADRELVPLQNQRMLIGAWVERLALLTPWGKKQSHATPFGTFGVRKPSATVKLVDDEKLLAWAMVNRPDEVMTEESVHWGKFKRLLDPDKPLPDGVERVPEAVNPYVDVAK